VMALRVEGMHSDTIQEKKAKENVKSCLRLYLGAKPKLSADFLTALQSLAGWLRDDAVTHSHVQSILNRRIAARFPTAILLLDGYMYIIIIGCFSFASRSHIQYRFGAEELPYNTSEVIFICVVGATYFLIREIVQVMSMLSLGTFRSWFTHYENWLGITVISLIYYYCAAMERRGRELDRLTMFGTPDYGSEDDQAFRTGVAFTVGALWLSVVNFLKSTMLEFSVFVETVLYVTKNLFVFMISLAVIVFAVAQMFLIVFRQTPVCSASCMQDYGDFPHCTFNKSLL
jgi:hypothetical protein